MPLDYALFQYLSIRERLTRTRYAMSFLAPLFLLGLAALAVPVLDSPDAARAEDVVEFPSLMFLRKIPYESVQRRRIRDWLLLALRAGGAGADRRGVRAAVPARLGAGGRPPAARARSSCCSIAPTAWATATRGRARSARRAARSRARPAGRSRLAGAVRRPPPRSRCDRAPTRRARSRRSTRRAGVAGATTLRPGLEARRRACSPNRSLPRKEVILVTDFQRSGWQPDEALRLPAGTRVHAGRGRAGVARRESALTPVVAAARARRRTGARRRSPPASCNRGADGGDQRPGRSRDRRPRGAVDHASTSPPNARRRRRSRR